MTEGQTPAGWYDDGRGQRRWFDGTAWTEHALPSDAVPEPVAEQTPQPVEPTVHEPDTAPMAPGTPRTHGSVTEPSKPFYKRAWVIVLAVIALVVLAGGIAVLASSDSDTASPTPSPTTSVPVVPIVPTPTPTPVPTGAPTSVAPTASPGSTGSATASPTSTALADGDWTVASYQFKPNPIDDFGGTARITYNGSDAAGGAASFTFTILKKDKLVATLTGSILDARPGQTKTVDLISTDKYVKGPYSSVEFQKDF